MICTVHYSADLVVSHSNLRDFLFPENYVGHIIEMTYPSARSSMFESIRITNTNLEKWKSQDLMRHNLWSQLHRFCSLFGDGHERF